MGSSDEFVPAGGSAEVSVFRERSPRPSRLPSGEKVAREHRMRGRRESGT
ncbi:hypothetical protein [Pinisolibacter aquiterrae]|nr:hypothetical protein [Pinisolibacter aquiterrae]MBV5263865.1 hypothetical protein [Pinisolibacter aquiterrae]MCC8235845.1 hypothetical protein [Pinisolibacter aquiterrae]